MTVPPWLRRAAGACLVLLVALLPALIAGSQIDLPAAPGELERLTAAFSGTPPSQVSAGFLRSFAAAETAAIEAAPPTEQARLLAQARLAQLVGLLGLSLLTYLALVLAAGRARALLTCAFLCALPAVTGHGHVLRHETPATLLGLLAFVLLLGIPTLQRPEARALSRAPVLVAIGLTSAMATGFAFAALPATGILMLVPGVAMFAVAAQLAWRLLVVLRRRLWVVVPLRAASARLWPWVLASIAGMFAAVLLHQAAIGDENLVRPAAPSGGLLPASAWLSWPLAALAALGGVRLLVRAGLQFGRGGRLLPEVLLLVFCAVLLGQRLLVDPANDALLAAAPTAVLLAEGSIYAVLLLAGRRRPRHR